jgi:hypothetical protein
MYLLESVSENFDINFMMKEFPADKPYLPNIHSTTDHVSRMLKGKAFTQSRKLSYIRIARIDNSPTKKFRVNKNLAHVARCVLADWAVTYPPRFWNTSETSDSRDQQSVVAQYSSEIKETASPSVVQRS